MDAVAERLLDQVRADLAHTRGLRLRVLDEPATADYDTPSFWLLSAHGVRTGVLVHPNAEESQRLADVADQIQEFVLEELGRLGRSAAWPACPEHPTTHPLTATLADGQACWQCPASGTVIAAIGTLAETRPPGR